MCTKTSPSLQLHQQGSSLYEQNQQVAPAAGLRGLLPAAAELLCCLSAAWPTP
jgi:hypothetical protein